VSGEVMKITLNDSVNFIQFLFRQTNYKEQFKILDCGLRIDCMARAISFY
jgi:hypothetical protein